MMVTMSFALNAYAQSASLVNKLVKEPHTQCQINNYSPSALAEIIERTACKMSYDTVREISAAPKRILPGLAQIIDSTARKMSYDTVREISADPKRILLIRVFRHIEFQYRLLLQITSADSGSYLNVRGFWFLRSDSNSIPPYGKSLKKAERDYEKLFIYALDQEIEASSQATPLPSNSNLPNKSLLKFMGWNLVSPGLASCYMEKDHPRVSRKSAIARSIVLGVLDLGSLALFVLAPERDDCPCQYQADPGLMKFPIQQMGVFGMLSSRAAMMASYFGDAVYRDLRKSGYYFPKLSSLNFKTKYLKCIEQ